ncbi:unnamed protein product [Adineta steineri]|uniref:Integral membrane bound transporter domain-containing protein n=1 Tax=Adineta steineri TaxID=433720 RepID=A0A818XBS7_9BILA|nr:unnamed protein product [Adineta steineri]CAF3737364.1 unnamed protein product [Adineta steineri]
MDLLLFFQTIRHIYLNYHFGERSSRWINSTLTRHFQFSFRMIIAFSLASFLTYGTNLKNHLSLLFMIPNITILLIQETFGLTLSTNIQLMLIIIPLSIFFYILQNFHLIYYHYLLSEFFYLFTSLIISYQCTQIPTRKLSLLFNSLFFVTIINQKNLPKFFAFQLLEIFLIGILISILISLFIFPLFATFDIENRFNYCLLHLQHMYHLIIQAYLCQDQISAKIFLSRAHIIEKMIRKTMITTQSRFDETYYEPSRLLQKLFNRRRRYIIDLDLQDQQDLICSLILHICSLELLVKQCNFNEYHNNCMNELKSSLLNLSRCQSLFISCLIPHSSSITRDEVLNHLTNLQLSFDSVHSLYIKVRLQSIENTFQSDDVLSHAFFLFQLNSIVQLLTKTTLVNRKKQKLIKNLVQGNWSRCLTALKTMIIIAVGSIFVMIPYLANKFENGQWILIAVCMTQGDTVGGAFTTMKMRLIGTLFGAMWAYITYLSAGDDTYRTILMLCPWIFFCGYMKLFPQWGYTVTVAASTPIVVNLGRLPFADSLPAGNYALLRIQQNVIGISIALVLTIIIFPVFAIDLLKENIHSTLELCRNNVESIVHIYKKVFHNEDETNDKNLIDFSKFDDIKFHIDNERRCFLKLISIQRTLVGYACIEPSCWWLNNGFSTSRYKKLLEQQIDIYRMLHNINTCLLRMNECLHIDTIDGIFLPEFNNLSKQLNDCLKIWSSYFYLTKTKSYQIFRGSIHQTTSLIQSDLNKYEQCLIELHRTVVYLQIEHEKATNSVLKYYFQRFLDGESSDNFIPYVKNNEIDSIYITLSAMHYSIAQLAQAALSLGTTIHDVFELETTNLYQPF